MPTTDLRARGRAARRTGVGVGVGVGMTLVLAGGLLAGCTAASEEPAPTGSAATGTRSGSGSDSGTALVLDAASVREHGTPVTSGGVTLSVVVADEGPVASNPEEDGTVRVVLSTAPGVDAAATVALAAPEGATLDVQADGSVIVRDGGGTFVAGLSVPHATTEAGATRTEHVRVDPTSDEAVVTWSVTASSGSAATSPTPGTTPAPSVVTAELASSAVRSATWREIDDEGGRSLAVVPTTWAREASAAAAEGLWTQLVAIEPEAGTSSMHDQLTCHTIGAPDKASWNLEPWRPDVGLLAVIAAYCNPE